MGHHSDECRLRNEAVARALADNGRPARDRTRDKRDHMGEVLAFASIVPAEIVADFLPFRGYYTRLFAALVGVAGRAYAVVPEELTRIERIAKGRAEIAGFAAREPAIEFGERTRSAGRGAPRACRPLLDLRELP
jgi:predicted methyltransferase